MPASESPAAASPSRYNVLGVGLSAINLESGVAHLLAAAHARRKGYVCVTGVHGVSEAQDDPAFRTILNNAFLNTPDGMPMVWLGRWMVGRDVDRVYGPDLMLALCDATQGTGLRHYFYGGAPGVADELAGKLTERFSQLTICGTHCPPFRPLNSNEREALHAEVAQARPDFFWVGLSTPKQEKFMAEYLPELDASIMLGVGAAFDFHSGRVTQAPRWIQRSGFEWLFRLVTNPGRLWRRYLRNNPLFIWRIALQLSGLRRYRIDDPDSR